MNQFAEDVCGFVHCMSNNSFMMFHAFFSKTLDDTMLKYIHLFMTFQELLALLMGT